MKLSRAPRLNRPECGLPMGSLGCGATFWSLGAVASTPFGTTSSRVRMSLKGRQRPVAFAISTQGS